MIIYFLCLNFKNYAFKHTCPQRLMHKLSLRFNINQPIFENYKQLMSLFTNQNFISQIIKQQGASDFFDQDTFPVLQALIEAETRRMVEKASKFMHSDKRDNLSSQDIENAINQMGHQDLFHLSARQNKYSQQNNQYLLQDPTFKDVSAFIEQEMKSLQSFSMPTLRGRFIYINKKIPKINQNHQLKSLQDIKQIKTHQFEEKKKNFNIIRDEPQSQLTKEQIDYYNEIVGYLTNNVGTSLSNGKEIETEASENGKDFDIEVKGCIVNVLPLILKFVINLGVNQNCIKFLLKAIENKYVWSSLEYNLHQILIVLMAYEGRRSFNVGQKVGFIVNRFGQKYPNLYDIFQEVDDSYSNLTKKIGFELVTGIAVHISYDKLKEIEEKSLQNNKQASMCLKALIENWSSIRCLRQKRICEEYGYVYWYGSKELDNDPYMNMY